MTDTRLAGVRAGALQGAEVWFAYGTVETVFAGLVPFFALKASSGLSHGSATSALLWVSPAFTLFTLAIYTIVGAALGAGAVLVSRPAPGTGEGRTREIASIAAACGLLLGFAASAAFQHQRPPMLLAGIGLLAVALRGLWSWRTPGSPDVRHLAGSWSLAALLGGGAYLLADVLPVTSLRVPLGILYSGVVLLFGMAAGRLAPRDPRRLWLGALGQGLVAACVVGSTVLIGAPRPSLVPQPTVGSHSRGPSVVLITLDSVRADHLRLLDNDDGAAPNLRRLAAQSSVYSRAIASSNQTLSTHASLFTGLRPTRHLARPDSVLPVGTAIASEVVTLPELLARRGYETCGVAANAIFLDSSFGFARGFTRYDSPWLVQFYSPSRPYLLRQGLRDLAVMLVRPGGADALFVAAPDVNARATACLREAATDRVPSFVFVNYMDAHTPYLPPAPFDTRYPGKMQRFAWDRYGYFRADVMSGREGSLGDRERRHLVSQYDGGIAYLDQQIGQLLDGLRALGRFDDSLIIVTSDHGEAFGEDGVLGHGVTLHDHQVHVPLLVKYPRANAGDARVVSEPVGTVDIFATILDVVGAPIPDDIDGVSLRQLEKRSPSRPVLAESFGGRPGDQTRDSHGRSESAAFRGALKVVLDARGDVRLYDMSSGHEQPRELSTSGAAAWKGWLASVLHTPGPTSRPASVDSPERDILRSLGYIGR